MSRMKVVGRGSLVKVDLLVFNVLCLFSPTYVLRSESASPISQMGKLRLRVGGSRAGTRPLVPGLLLLS